MLSASLIFRIVGLFKSPRENNVNKSTMQNTRDMDGIVHAKGIDRNKCSAGRISKAKTTLKFFLLT